jgi:hypothetical protein
MRDSDKKGQNRRSSLSDSRRPLPESNNFLPQLNLQLELLENDIIDLKKV